MCHFQSIKGVWVCETGSECLCCIAVADATCVVLQNGCVLCVKLLPAIYGLGTSLHDAHKKSFL